MFYAKKMQVVLIVTGFTDKCSKLKRIYIKNKKNYLRTKKVDLNMPDKYVRVRNTVCIRM